MMSDKNCWMLVGLLLLMTVSVWAETTEVIITSDTWITGMNPTANYSSLTWLWIAPNKNGLVYADLTGQIPEGMVVKKAELDIWITYLATNTAIDIYRETDDWDQNTATWYTSDGSTIWGGSEGGFGVGMAVDTDVISSTVIMVEPNEGHVGWHQFDITAAAQLWQSDGNTNHGLLIRRTGGDGFKFYSCEGLSHPKFNITYGLPDPVDCAQVWERGLGLAGDVNQDCEVNMADFSLLAGTWLSCNDPDRAGDPN